MILSEFEKFSLLSANEPESNSFRSLSKLVKKRQFFSCVKPNFTIEFTLENASCSECTIF
jgi:hypothetical protein